MADDGQFVTIEVRGFFADVKPACASIVAPLLECQVIRISSGGPRGYRIGRKLKQFCDRIANNKLAVPANCVPAIKIELERAGYQVVVWDRRPTVPTMDVDRVLIDAADGENRRLLTAVAESRRGLIEIASDDDLVWAIPQICKLHNKARVMIPVRTRDEIVALHRRLKNHLPGQIRMQSRDQWGRRPQQIVCTLCCLPPAMPSDFDVVILPCARDALPYKRWRNLVDVDNLGLGNRKAFGFVRPGETGTAHERLMLQIALGSVIYRTPDAHGDAAHVRVAWCPSPATRLATAGSPLEYKRTAYWHNTRRNDLVVRVAEALAVSDVATLGQCGVTPALQSMLAACQRRPRITILVESAEHAQQLLGRLAGWRLWSPPPAQYSGERRVVTIADCLAAVSLDQTIVTTIEAQSIKDFVTDVVIVAAGSDFRFEFPGFPPRAVGGQREVVVLDFADRGDSLMRDATQQRCQHYVAMGWESRLPSSNRRP